MVGDGVVGAVGVGRGFVGFGFGVGSGEGLATADSTVPLVCPGVFAASAVAETDTLVEVRSDDGTETRADSDAPPGPTSPSEQVDPLPPHDQETVAGRVTEMLTVASSSVPLPASTRTETDVDSPACSVRRAGAMDSRSVAGVAVDSAEAAGEAETTGLADAAAGSADATGADTPPAAKITMVPRPAKTGNRADGEST